MCAALKKNKQNLLPHNGTLSGFFCYEGKGLACLQHLYHQCVWTDKNMKIIACKEAVAQSSMLYVCGKLFIFFLEYFTEKNVVHPKLVSCCNKKKSVKIGAICAHLNVDSSSSFSSFHVQSMPILTWQRSVYIFKVRMGMSKSHGCYQLHSSF